MRFSRYHGLGNDYLVVEDGYALDPRAVPLLCHRNTGIGADGVLIPFQTDRADLGVTIVNPDGSVAEKSGNGLRILAAWWVHSGLAPSPSFSVWTGYDRVQCLVEDDTVTVQMGRVSFEPADIGLASTEPWIERLLDGPGGPWHVTSLSIGNPHTVIFVDDVDLDALPWPQWGAFVERHICFKRRTNVQIAYAGPAGIRFRVWERGAGVTAASGSSAVAVTAAAIKTARVGFGHHRVQMSGGEVEVTVSHAWDTTLKGVVERIGRVHLDDAWTMRHITG